MRTSAQPLSKFIFYALLACLPINLGLHFIYPSAYVEGLLIDYLVPAIYVQDILSVILVASWVNEYPREFIATLKSRRIFLLVLFTYTLFLSVLLAPRLLPSAYMFVRWFIYALVSLYVYSNFDWEKDLKVFSKILCGWVFVLGLVALGQYINQGSIFDNYLILGEQPYSSSTPLIDKENIFGSTKVPAYGIFRHPNIFGGFLALSLVFILYAYQTSQINLKTFLLASISGIVSLLLTFSYFSWLATALGLLLVVTQKKPILKTLISVVFIGISAFSLFINRVNFYPYFSENPSVFKRVELLQAGYNSVNYHNYLFGSGLNSSVIFVERFMEPQKFLRFVQPPHNIFVLLASEVGIIGLVLFLSIFIKALVNSRKRHFIVYVALLQVLLLSSFDHYFLTIHQTFLYLWLLFGLAL